MPTRRVDIDASECDTQAAATPATSASAPSSSGSKEMMQVVDGKFTDFRWKIGAWDLESDAFKKDGKTNWDLVSHHTASTNMLSCLKEVLTPAIICNLFGVDLEARRTIPPHWGGDVRPCAF